MSIQLVPVLQALQDVSGGNLKTPQKEYLETGKFPIVDQGQNLIGGYTDDVGRLCKAKLPVIVFGDHTRAVKYVDFPFCMGADGTKILTPRAGNDPRFLFHAISALNLEGAGYSRHFKFLKEKLIPLPSLAEQKRIAKILDAADALRAKRHESLAQLDALLQSTFLEMFGDPERWPQASLGSLAATGRGTFSNGPFGSNLLTSELTESGVPVVYIRDIRNGEYARVSEVCVTPEKAQSLSTCQVISGDILIAKVGDPPGISAVYPPGAELAIITQDVIRLRANDKRLVPEYFSAYLNSEFGRRMITQITVEATRARFGLKDLKASNVPLPPLEVQSRFGRAFDCIEKHREQLREQLRSLDALFISLQQRAFTGQL